MLPAALARRHTAIITPTPPYVRKVAGGRSADGYSNVAAEGFVAWSLLRPKWRTAGAAIGVVVHIGFVVMITRPWR